MTDTFKLTGRLLDKTKRPIIGTRLQLLDNVTALADPAVNEVYTTPPVITTNSDGYLCAVVNGIAATTLGVSLVVGPQYTLRGTSGALGVLIFSAAQAVDGVLDIADIVPEPPATPPTFADVFAAEATARAQGDVDTLAAAKTYTDQHTPVGGVTSVNNRTGAVTLAAADVGLGQVNNTPDSGKPVSTAQQTALDGKVPTSRTVAGKPLTGDVTLSKGDVGLGNVDNTPDSGKPISTAQAAALAAKADLVNGTVPAVQLPSYVDDVVEYSNLAAFPATGETGKLYIALDTGKLYRWSGSVYAVISDTIALGETANAAYRGDRGKAAFDHSQITTGNPHGTTASDVGAPTTAQFNAEVTRAQTAEGNNATAISNEAATARAAEQANADALTLRNLGDLAVAAPGALTAGRTNVLTVAGTYTAPVLAAAVGNPPQRFAVRNDGTATVMLSLPDGGTGSTLTLSILPGMARVYRQISTQGYGLEDGIPKAILDAVYQPGYSPQRRPRVGDTLLRQTLGASTNVPGESYLIVDDLWLPGAVGSDGVTPISSTYGTWWFEVSNAGSAGAVARLVVYAHDPVLWRPSTLLAASGQISATTAANKSVSLAVPVPPQGRLVWAGVVVQGGATTRPTLRTVGADVGPMLIPSGAGVNMNAYPSGQSTQEAANVSGAPAVNWGSNGNGGSDVVVGGGSYAAARIGATRTA